MKRATILGFVVLVGVLAASCAPAVTPTPERIVETVEVPVKETVVVEPTPLPYPEEVKVGVIYPLTGAGGMGGFKALQGALLAEEIINHEYPELGDFPFAKTVGIPNLGGATWRIVFADHQGKPELGVAETERFITEEGVVVFSGLNWSGVTIASRVVTERYGIPMINDISSSQSLNLERAKQGLKWYFSNTPDDYDNAIAVFDVLDELREEGAEVERLLIVNSDSQNHMEAGDNCLKLAEERGYEVVERIIYPEIAPDLTPEVIRAKGAAPDVVILAVFPEGCINFLKASKTQDFNPKTLMASVVGCSGSLLYEEMGADADYIVVRDQFSLDLAESLNRPEIAKINEMFRMRSGGIDLDADSGRAFQGQIIIATIINNAGSTDPEAIRQAALDLDMTIDELITPWDCVKYDPETGKNTCARSLLLQAQEGRLRLVFPPHLAAVDIIWPWPKWDER